MILPCLCKVPLNSKVKLHECSVNFNHQYYIIIMGAFTVVQIEQYSSLHYVNNKKPESSSPVLGFIFVTRLWVVDNKKALVVTVIWQKVHGLDLDSSSIWQQKFWEACLKAWLRALNSEEAWASMPHGRRCLCWTAMQTVTIATVALNLRHHVFYVL